MIHRVNTHKFRHEELWNFMRLSSGNQKILDVGCGNGWFLQKFHDKVSRNLYGCDCVRNLAFNNFHFSHVDLNEQELPYEDAMFDIVVCSDVLEHLENPSKCIREIRRVVKPNGTLFITIPNCANILQRLYYLFHGNLKRFSPKPGESAPHISILPTRIFRYLVKSKFTIKRGGDGFIFHSYLFDFLPARSILAFTLFMELRPII